MGFLSNFAGDLFGNVVGAFIGAKGERDANQANRDINSANNAFNAEQAGLNRDFQREMSNTQYQRAVTDMKAAGLNPMLAYSQGGAGTPSGSAASASAVAPMRNTAAAGLQSAMGVATVANMKEQNELLKTQQEKTRAETETERNRPENLRAGTEGTIASAAESRARTELIGKQYNKTIEEMELVREQTKSERLRQDLTREQTTLTRADQLYRKGQISIQEFTQAIEESEARIRRNLIQGSAEEAEFQRVGGQFSRWLKTLNPLTGVIK